MRLLSRRTLLRGAGGAVLGLPVLDAMLTIGGRLPGANAAGAPRRLVIFFTGEGFPMSPTNEWRPIVGTGPSDFQLSTMLAPLEPVKRQSLFIEGVPYTSSNDSRQRAQGHPAGAQAVLTGAWAGDGTSYGGAPGRLAGFSPYPSIDYLIGKEIGSATRFPALYLGVNPGGTSPAARPFVAADQKGIAVQGDPRAAFDSIFGDFNGANPGESVAASQKRRADDRKVVLDSVLGDLKSLGAQVGADDRRRLDQHATQLAEIQRKVSVPPPAAPNACVKPVRSTITDRSFANAPALAPAQLDLLAMALACDRTRVACFSMSHADADGGEVHRWLGHTRDHHDISHLTKGHAEDSKLLVQIAVWQATQLMTFIKKLQAVAEPGGTLFDNTVILWCSEIGNGWTHDRNGPVFTIIGSGQGYFKTGRYLNFGGGSKNAHSKLLLHILNYMGVPATSVGDPMYSAGGPLPNITTA